MKKKTGLDLRTCSPRERKNTYMWHSSHHTTLHVRVLLETCGGVQGSLSVSVRGDSGVNYYGIGVTESDCNKLSSGVKFSGGRSNSLC